MAKNLEQKKCIKCKKTKSLSSFYKQPQRKDGLTTECKPCYMARVGPWRDKNKEAVAEYHRKYRAKNRERLRKNWRNLYAKNPEKWAAKRRLLQFGLSNSDYLSIKASQDYSCAICKTPESELLRKMAVDHCHSSGVVRGLLCDKCNRGLGYFKDSSGILEAAANYLVSRAGGING